MAIHSKLSTLMGAKRLSIADVHEKTGLSRTTISNLYYDKATRLDYDTIDRLCRLFDCDVNGILSYSSNCEKENAERNED